MNSFVLYLFLANDSFEAYGETASIGQNNILPSEWLADMTPPILNVPLEQ